MILEWRQSQKGYPVLRSPAVFAAFASILISSALAAAAAAKAYDCDQAAEVAAQRHDIPVDILLAITRVETGRTGKEGLSPWPWTVNLEGAGHWFKTEDQARAFVFRHFKKGARSFDVGCFQINYKWHGRAFQSIEDMFDPVLGADYAAQLLKNLYAELGNWSEAAGAYHSRTPALSRKYSARFDTIRTSLPDSNPAGDMTKRSSSRAARPLIGSTPASLGSLVTFQDTDSRQRLSLIKQR
ncbi:lytic transglycosylase domain-containing protein [Phaeobacter marinintestinus]|uniref:lytic transglycosylase domain-containing protein n=1 Tax=Falsiphaeobacter marinintestinus TaxID=1492905 RepID=UPI0011B7C849|nr:lytic transglycosylase domain-containing protein [Phaeobacter marinintestinus]